MSRGKTLRRILAVLGLLLCAIVIAGFFVLRSHWLHRLVLAEIVQKGQAGTGARLQLQDWSYRLHPLAIELDGIVVPGIKPSGTQRPLLQIERLTVGVKFRALLHRRLELSELLIEHPVANVSIDSNGKSNLPTPPKQSGSSLTIWTLSVGHTLLTDGEIFYNDRKTQLDADLHDLQTQIQFDAAATRYSGSLAYRDGHLQYANHPVLPHNLTAQFSATPQGASLDSLLLTVGSSRISARGQFLNYESPDMSANYEILIHTPDFASFAQGVSPAGDVQINGAIHYRDVPGQSFLENASLDGNLASANLLAASPDGRVALNDLTALYRLANGNLDVSDLVAHVIGGRLSGSLTLHGLESVPTGAFSASLQQASIESARFSIKRADLKRLPVTGRVDAAVRGNWTGTFNNIRLLGNVQAKAAVGKDSSDQKLATPVDANVHFAYDVPHNNITLHQTTVQIPSASVVLDGELSRHSNLQVHATAGDLHRLAELASALRSSESESSSPAIEISGPAKLDAVMQGSLQRPSISGQIAAENLQVQGSQWKTVKAVLHADPSQVTITQASLVNARQGNLVLSGQVRLQNWSYLPSNTIHANISAQGLSLADLQNLAHVSYPLSGNLSAQISLQGSELHPAGHGSLQIVNATAYKQPIQNLALQFHTANDSIESLLSVTLPAGTASGTLDFTPKTKAYKLDLRTPGLVLQKLQAITAKKIPIQGTLTASATGAGTIENPQLDVVLQLPALQVRETSLTAIKAEMKVENQHAYLSLDSSVAQVYVRASATVDLVRNFYAQASIDTSKISLDPLLAVYAPGMPPGFHGETELHASLRGPLKNTSQLEAHLTIPTLTGTYQSLQFANVGPIRADYANSVIVLAPGEIRGTDTSIHFQGRLPLTEAAGVSLQAQGDMNLALLNIFSSDMTSRGTLDFDIHGAGSIHQPSMQGTVQVRNAALSISSAPIAISKVNGSLTLNENKVQISSLTGEMGGGSVSVGGSVAFSPSLQFNLAVQGRSMRMLYPAGVRSVLDGDLTFTGNLQAAAVRGRVLIDSLNFTPDFDLSSFVSQFNTPSIPPLNQTFSDNIQLAVALLSSQNLSARSSQISLSGMTNLQVIGTVANPVIIGRVDLASGELFFMSNRYVLQRGILSFNDPNQTTPVLNVQVTSTIEQYNLTLTFTGPLDRLSTSYVSNPALPTADVISLIYRGQTTEEAAAAGTSTDSLLAGPAASQFSSGLQKLTGISSLQIDPLLGGNGTNPTARIAVQQRVTNNFLFTFSTDVSQPESEIILGQYQLSPRWSISVERDQLGGIAVDGHLHTKF